MARSALANGEQQPLQRSVVLGVCLYLCASPGVTLGQATEESVDEIVVVGTHIRQVDPDGPSPVTIFDRDALERTGAPTVARAMHRLPFGNDGSFNDSDAFSTALGGSGISFRGLGANAVLILINGRRVAPYGFSFQSDTLISFVDLNSIPIGAVERIEILKDGASAIYGSDAIAGVVNIVLREDMTGIEIEARAGAPSESGAEEVGINAIWGHTSERTNIELIANYSNREALLWRDRDISKTADFSNRGGTDQRALQSTNFQINDTWAAYGAECDERAGTISGVQDFELLESGTCIYDPNSVIAEPSVERVGLMAILNREIGNDLTLHVEASYQDSAVISQTTPELFFGENFPFDNPWNPFPPAAFGPDLPFAYSFTETGSAIEQVDTETTRAVVSLEGIRGNWIWEVGALFSRSASSWSGERGFLSADAIDAALNGVDLDGDGTLQPDEYWNLYSSASNPNSQALSDTLHVPRLRESETELFSVDGLISGPIMSLPAGKLRGAFGFEFRDESLHDQSNQASLEEQLAGGLPPFVFFLLYTNPDTYSPFRLKLAEYDDSLSPTAIGSRTQYSVFGELHVPIVKNLDMQLALRFEDYSDFGTDTNPRIALRYQLWSRLTFRASWGQSFRAPSLAELNLGPSAEAFMAWDPQRCPDPETSTFPIECSVGVFAYVTSGNPGVQPETSESVSIGFTAGVWKGLAISANYWNIEHNNRIVAPGLDSLLENELIIQAGSIERDPQLQEDIADGIPGRINRVNNWFINLAEHNVSGFDVDATFDTELGGLGTLSSRLLWTRLESSEFAFNPNDPLEELAGTYGNPKIRASLDVFLSTTNWAFGVYGHWTDGYEDPNRTGDVDSYLVWDGQISNFNFNGVRLTLGVDNMFDEAPPFSVGESNLQGFNNQFYSMRGRMVYVRVTWTL